MSKEITVQEEVFAALQAQAEPLVDDVNSVLRRLLGLSGSPSGSETPRRPAGIGRSTSRQSKGGRGNQRKPTTSARAARGTLLPESEYEIPILMALEEMGESGPASRVIERVGEMLADKLTPDDTDLLPGSGLVRWKSRTQFVRLRLTERGDMNKGSPRGVWEISPQGLQRLSKDRTAL